VDEKSWCGPHNLLHPLTYVWRVTLGSSVSDRVVSVMKAAINISRSFGFSGRRSYLCRNGVVGSYVASVSSGRRGLATTIFDVVEDNSLFDIPLENIRNFSVIAHVDHGKSTLSDAILSLAGNIQEADRRKGQVLDTLKVERERGITVKAQTASLIFNDARDGKRYLLNLIDTPGHIDFSYEVSRSLASCQGALLLVDSSQSIQAQTLSNYEKARALGLDFIPIVTKIDLPNAQPEEAALNMGTTFGIEPDKVLMTSAKKGIGIKEVLEAIVDRLPSPKASVQDPEGPTMCRIIDSWYDEHRGVVCLVQMVGGTLKEGQKVTTFASSKSTEKYQSNISSNSLVSNDSVSLDGGNSEGASSASEISNHKEDYSVQELGVITPGPVRTKQLTTGQVRIYIESSFSRVIIVLANIGGLLDSRHENCQTSPHRRHNICA
jgi:small GTP-binding protein